jgi:hypothetical protein
MPKFITRKEFEDYMARIGRDITDIKSALIGDDMRGGLVKDVADLKNSYSQLFLDLQRARQVQIDDRKVQAEDRKDQSQDRRFQAEERHEEVEQKRQVALQRLELSMRWKIAISVGVLSLLGILVGLVEHILHP